MPKLDGISATSMIRQFDNMTPIISMTSNSKPNEILIYYSSDSGEYQLIVLVSGVANNTYRDERHITETLHTRRSTQDARGIYLISVTAHVMVTSIRCNLSPCSSCL